MSKPQMIISDASPLRTLPQSLSEAHILLMDGVRYSVDMMDFAYSRLAQSLLIIGQTNGAERHLFSLVFQDAWSLVDSIERLRKLIPRVPIKKTDPAFELFLRKASEATELRHSMQHMDNDLRDPERLKSPMWGTLRWVTAPRANQNAQGFLLVSGSIFDVSEHSFINPVGHVIRVPLDLVTLNLGTQEVNLSEQMRKIVDVVRVMEREFVERYGNETKRGADVFVGVDYSTVLGADGVSLEAGDKLTISMKISKKNP